MKQVNVGIFANAFKQARSFGTMLDRHAQWSAQLESEAAVADAAAELQQAISQPGQVCRFVRLSVLVMAPPGADDAACRGLAVAELTQNISEIDLYVDAVDPEIDD